MVKLLLFVFCLFSVAAIVLVQGQSSTSLGSSPEDILRELKHYTARIGATISDHKYTEAHSMINDAVSILRKLQDSIDPVKIEAQRQADAATAMENESKPKLEDLEIKTTFKPSNCDKTAESGDWLRVHYVAKTLSDGQIFSSSFATGSVPYKFVLGSSDAFVEGWNIGLVGACPEERRRLLVPAALGYGEKGTSMRGFVVPPNSDLQFDIEVVSVSKSSANSKKKKGKKNSSSNSDNNNSDNNNNNSNSEEDL